MRAGREPSGLGLRRPKPESDASVLHFEQCDEGGRARSTKALSGTPGFLASGVTCGA